MRPPPHHRIGRDFLGCAALGGSELQGLPTVYILRVEVTATERSKHDCVMRYYFKSKTGL